ncbi:MAG: DNA adenine methylase [Deltaproteobacteria bacterium]|nr:DNA adenine methylase [Deltaproteobacteria bacterium]
MKETDTDAKKPRPFLKWAGGKRQLLRELLQYRPKKWGCYHEPFVGGGAVFFDLRPERAVLCDSNKELIDCYIAVRDQVDKVIHALKKHHHDKEYYYQIREQNPDKLNPATRAARMIYLNKTGFNGLYRVNSKNFFNVPFGRYVNPTICDESNLRACSAALQHIDILCSPFENVLKRARAGDFVYFDPPYVPLSFTSSFTSYTEGKFSMEDQTLLRDVAVKLKNRGVFVLLSNSSAPAVMELYSKGFELIPVSATRLVNSKAKGRGKITELLIR